MKTIYTLIIALSAFCRPPDSFAQEVIAESMEKTITPDDLHILLGEWTGNLTYIDYSSNKPYTMPANLIVDQGKDENKILLKYLYPKEPKANSKSRIKISKDGRQLNNNIVTSKDRLANGQIQITTEHSGKDNHKKAVIRMVYILGKENFIIRKNVKFENSDKWLSRNEYHFKR